MARVETITFEVPATEGVGAAQDVERFAGKTFECLGVTGILHIEMSFGIQDVWAVHGLDVAGPEIRAVPETVKWIRIRRTVDADDPENDTSVVTMKGFDQRTF